MKKLFAIDCHISVIYDLQWMAKSWGDLQIDDWSLSNHTHLIGKQKVNPEFLSDESWRNLSPAVVARFYDRYKDELGHYDGFICAYPFPFCLLWEKFRKPIYAVQCIRYEFPFSWDPFRRKWLSERVAAMMSSGQLRVVANNKYDAAYFGLHEGLSIPRIPNLCAYTGAKFTGRKPHLWTSSKVPVKGLDRIGSPFPKNYSWQDVADGSGVVFLPYNTSVMSFFEWYTAGIPVLVPTKKWLAELGMSELAFNGALNRPNNAGDLSDYYDSEYFPHTIEVESAAAVRSVSRRELLETARNMEVDEPRRREKIMAQWRTFLFTS